MSATTLRFTRLRNPVSRLAGRSPWRSAFTALSLACLIGCHSSSPEGLGNGIASEWGVPVDLVGHGSRLTELALPEGVTHLAWLREFDDLQILDASRTSVTSVDGLPSGLRILNASYTDVTDLASLPRTVDSIDIAMTRVKDLKSLPPSLRELSIGGFTREDKVSEAFEYLPADLSSLVITSSYVRNLDGLPRSLRSLVLANCEVEDVSGLPDSLELLSIRGSKLTESVAFPPSLQSLEWYGNPGVRVGRLPSYMLRLKVDDSQVPFGDLRFLEELYLMEGAGLEAMQRIPPSVRRLGLRLATEEHLALLPAGIEVLWLPQFMGSTLEGLPPDLRVLDLSWSDLDNLKGLPQGLESLTLDGLQSASMTDLPTSLRILQVRWSALVSLGNSLAACQDLEDLDLEGSGSLRDLGSLPPRLVHLNIRSTQVDALLAVPESVRFLDFSHSKVKALASLPPRLEGLIVAAGQIDTFEGLPPSVRSLRITNQVNLP